MQKASIFLIKFSEIKLQKSLNNAHVAVVSVIELKRKFCTKRVNDENHSLYSEYFIFSFRYLQITVSLTGAADRRPHRYPLPVHGAPSPECPRCSRFSEIPRSAPADRIKSRLRHFVQRNQVDMTEHTAQDFAQPFCIAVESLMPLTKVYSKVIRRPVFSV